MTHLGDIPVGDDINFCFTTVNAAGAPTQLAGSPAIRVYRDNNVTQDVAGITLSVDFDGVTGLNQVNITTIGNAAFYYDRASYSAVIQAGTVGGTSVVGYVVAQWKMRLSIAEQVWGYSVGAIGTVSDSFGGAFAEIWNKIGTYVDAAISSRSSQTTQDTINTNVSNIQTRIPAALIGGRMSSHVEAISDGLISVAKFTQDYFNAITAYVWAASVGQFQTVSDSFGGALAEMWATIIQKLDAAVSTRASTTDVAAVSTQVGLLQAGVHVSSIADGIITRDKFSETYWQAIADRVWGAAVGSYGTLSDAFGGAFAEIWTRVMQLGGSSGSSPTAADIADAVWDEVTAGHGAAGSFGANLDAAVSTRLATSGYTPPDNASIAAIGVIVSSISARLPTALVGGRLVVLVEAVSPGVISFDDFAQDYWNGIQSYVWTASVGQFAGVSDSFGSAVAEIWSRSAPLSDIADAVWDEIIESNVTARQSVRLNNSTLGAKLSGAGTGTEVIRDLADTKDRITATVDSSGNRTAIVRDLT